MPKFLIKKLSEPEQISRAYADSLVQLEGSEETLMETTEGVIKVREAPEDQIEELRRRLAPNGHILKVEYDATVKTPAPPEMDATAAGRITYADAERMVGIDRLHEMGITGKGMIVAIHDTGLHKTLYDRYRSQVHKLSNATSEPDSFDQISKHGSWIFSVLRHALPDAKFWPVKVLKTSDGSGQYSWVISGVEHTRGESHGSNASLGGPKSSIVNSAFDAADLSGLIMRVAAGNEQRGKTSFVADSVSPASAERTMTTGSKQSDNVTADYSNWGTCVRASGPGHLIECPDKDVVPGFYSGTSMEVFSLAVAMLLRSAGYEKEAVKQAVYASAKDGAEPAYKEGAGLVDGMAALAKLRPAPPKPEPAPEPKPTPTPEPPKEPEGCGDKPRWRNYQREASARYQRDKKAWRECTGAKGFIARMLGR